MFKKFFLVILTIIIVVPLGLYALNKVQTYSKNNEPLSKKYIDKDNKFSFNYPEKAIIYESSVNGDRWVRVFLNGKVGESCDLDIDTKRAPENPPTGYTVRIGSLNWLKTRADRGLFGGIYDAHGARWRANSKSTNYIWATEDLDYEPLCERIITTFDLKR